MNIIFINWACHCAYDACLAFTNLGHHVHVTQLPDAAHNQIDEAFLASLAREIRDMHCELVFSLNYFPTVSLACQNAGCRYISWIYDNPYVKAYDKTATNSCNLIFTFDSHMAATLQSRGVSNIRYAPMAANPARLTAAPITPEKQKRYSCDVAFVGSLYNETHNFYPQLLAKAKDPYLQGYLEGLLKAQQAVYGYNFLAECLTPEITDTIRRYMPYIPDEGSFIREEEIYADYYLARQLAFLERAEILYLLGQFFDVHLYTYGEISLGNVKNCGVIDYNDGMPDLFRIAKINLNCSLRSIKNGIPLRAMDILGCGGFLLSNFQEDFLLHFEPNRHFAAYTSTEEALELADYYLNHEEERRQIAANALELVKKEHTFEIRLQEMLEIAGKL